MVSESFKVYHSSICWTYRVIRYRVIIAPPKICYLTHGLLLSPHDQVYEVRMLEIPNHCMNQLYGVELDLKSIL